MFLPHKQVQVAVLIKIIEFRCTEAAHVDGIAQMVGKFVGDPDVDPWLTDGAGVFKIGDFASLIAQQEVIVTIGIEVACGQRGEVEQLGQIGKVEKVGVGQGIGGIFKSAGVAIEAQFVANIGGGIIFVTGGRMPHDEVL